MRNSVRKSISMILAATMILVGVTDNNVFAAKQKTVEKSLEEYKEVLNYTAEYKEYSEYISQYEKADKPTDEYVIDAADYIASEGMDIDKYDDYEGMAGESIYTGQDGYVEYKVNISTEGLYEMSLNYFPIEGNGSSIQRAFFIDGELPYRQMTGIEFSRVWTNENSTWDTDNQGNDLKPTQIEQPEWVTSKLYDVDGYVTEPLKVYMTKGVHTITVVSQREPMILRSITLKNDEKLKDYNTYYETQKNAGKNDYTGERVLIEAERATKKSSSMLYPTQDQSSPDVNPYSAKLLKNNTIGGESWSHSGQWIEWEFDAPDDGFYNITLHAKQNFVKGIYVSRKIMIDGEVPFSELNAYGFTYNSGWKDITLSSSDGEEYRFYLTKGTHTLRMQAVLGEFAPIISKVQSIVTELNSEYRKIIRITGVSPDENRDYQIEKKLPGLDKELDSIRAELDEVLTSLEDLGCKGSEETVIITMRDQLKNMVKNTDNIPKMVSDFKTNVSALGTWISNAQSQPLQLDRIYVTEPDKGTDGKSSSFFAGLGHEFKKLFYSFIVDYNSIGNVAEESKDSKAITVWIGSGRDQANVIKSLIDEKFTPKTGINVNVQLVDMNTLLQATLADQGPDVALQVASSNGAVVTSATGTTNASNDLPVNYGLRNAVVDLSEFEDCEEVMSRFRDSALEPFKYGDSLYALPETQNFQMMFYRKDILKELGIEIPKTWDEMKVVISELSKNQMTLGMLPSELTFDSILYQNNGALYNNDFTASALNSENAINAFKQYCEFYTDYKLDRATSVEQRFRTGESPIIIADYTTYNVLEVSAPDIKGLWGFTTLPGIQNEDGTINNTTASTGLACMMMKKTKDKNSSWEFMKWWLSEEIQTQYGKEMEGLMGEAARYPTANVKAFANLPWPTDDYEALEEQFKNVKGIPQVPGSYYTWRNVNNAFYSVVVAEDDKLMQPREALNEYVEYIDAEITNKRQEFGMTTAEDEK